MRTIVVGAGGHARSVIAALRSSGEALEPVACTDPDAALHGSEIDGVPVLGADGLLPELLDGGAAACLGLGAVGDNRPRARLYAHVAALGFVLPKVIHGRAHVDSTASIGAGSVVLAGALVGPGAVIGENVIVGTGAIVEHDCRIGDHAHLASGCVLGGAAAVAASAHVGLGAVVLQGRGVGPLALVGAGAVVVRDVPSGETVAGSPARTLTTANGATTDWADGRR
ncbi:MAG TPA: NeuD/PglB/VioB family sugar acetyltransferase [Solirubrobacteraceae bacterium]|jgi:UDP-perosamine 4-acetyltransferase